MATISALSGHLHAPSPSPPPPPSCSSSSHHSLPMSPEEYSIPGNKFRNKTTTIRTRLSNLFRQRKPDVARQVFDRLPNPSTVLWNTMIIGLICNDMSQEALEMYSRMKWSGKGLIKCDSYTYSSVLKACAEERQLRVGKAVHGHVLRSGIYGSAIVYNSLLNMYCCCCYVNSISNRDKTTYIASSLNPVNQRDYLGCCCLNDGFDLVDRVFGMMKKRNAVAWNVMVSWCVKTGRFYKAVTCFKQMMRIGIKPTVVGFVNVFPAVSGLMDVEAANVLYALLIKFGDEYAGNLFAVSSAISMFLAVGCVEVARKVFDSCLGKNAEVWNTMMGGYLKCLCCIEALELFVEALECSASLDDVTLVAALTGVSQLQELSMGKQLHAYIMKTSMGSSINVLNTVIAMYSRCDSIEESFKVFHEMKERDAVSWNSIITALVQNGLDEEGLMLVNEMKKQGFPIDSVAATALLSAASNLRSGSIGKQTHAYLIRHDIQFDGINAYLIDMYAKSGLVENSQKVFERTTKDHRDLATWNAMISGNVQNGMFEEAIDVLLQMLKESITPDAVTTASILPACSQIGGITLGAILSAENVFSRIPDKNHVAYNNMILAYAQHGMGFAALSLFNSMQFSGVTPDPVTLVAALSACSYAGLVREGLEIFHSMETKYKIKPTAEHYCCVVDMLGRKGTLTEAFLLAEEFGRRKDGYAVQAWGSLLAACKVHGRNDLAKTVADKLLDQTASGDSISGYFGTLSNIYVNKGNRHAVNRLRKEMKDRGMKKEAGRSWIEVAGETRRFRCSLTGIIIGTVTVALKIWRSLQAVGNIVSAYSYSLTLIEIQHALYDANALLDTESQFREKYKEDGCLSYSISGFAQWATSEVNRIIEELLLMLSRLRFETIGSQARDWKR
ncbi:Pentatricopeptide repeat-containing protein [Drosera capensis]